MSKNIAFSCFHLPTAYRLLPKGLVASDVRRYHATIGRRRVAGAGGGGALERLGTVTIVGVGLIGGSIGLALRARGGAERVVGLGRELERLDEARSLGAIDEGTTDPRRAVAEADIVVVCTPVSRIADDVRRLAPDAPPGALFTDAGSTKRRIVDAVEGDDEARSRFVAAHPLAGSERQGTSAARDDLFEGRCCVLTPTPQTPADLVPRAGRFWESIGCVIATLGPDAHDAALARTSHLPHVLAAALALSVPPEALPLAAGAYRDGTRVAASDAELWVAIFRENPEHLLRALGTFRHHLDRFDRALRDDDTDALRALWQSARSLRLQFDDGPASS